MKIEISGNCIEEEQDFHIQIANALGIQQYYGYNLHALWDLLSVGIERPVHLIWYDSLQSQLRLGDKFDQISSILERVRLQDEEYGWEDKFTYAFE